MRTIKLMSYEPPKSIEEIYSIPKDSSIYIINEKFLKSAVRHFLELCSSLTISAITYALQQEFIKKTKIFTDYGRRNS